MNQRPSAPAQGLASIGELRGFRAVLGARPPAAARDPGFWRRGVLDDPGAALLDKLVALLGPLEAAACADDGRGGVEAEAVLGLKTAAGATGEVVLSRLRPLGSSLVLEGASGRAQIDLETLPPGSPGAGLALVSAARALRTRLLQPWESAAEAGPGPLVGRKVAVIGATGFIGARLVELLAEQGAEVTAAARNLSKAARIARHPVRLVQADLADRRQIAEAVEGQEVVFNLAHDLERSGARNLRAYRGLAEAAAAAGVRRFVHTSSIAVYDAWPIGDLTEASPRDAAGYEYKDLKRAVERELAAQAARGPYSAAILQPTLVYGPFSKLWTDRYADWLATGDIVLPDGGEGVCNAVYVDDLVQAMILAGAARIPGAEAYIVSGAAPVAWKALLEGYAADLPGQVRYEPAPAASPGAASPPSRLKQAALGALRPVLREAVAILHERLGDERFEQLRRRVKDKPQAVRRPADAEPALYRLQGTCSTAKARRELGYEPQVDLAAGLARSNAYIAWRGGVASGRPAPAD